MRVGILGSGLMGGKLGTVGEKHWHGAAATTAMTHIAIQEQRNGKTADWMETVSDDQYALHSR